MASAALIFVACIGLTVSAAAAAPSPPKPPNYISNLVVVGDSIADNGISSAFDIAAGGRDASFNWWKQTVCPNLPGVPRINGTCRGFTEAGSEGNWVDAVQKTLRNVTLQNLAVGGATACYNFSSVNLATELSFLKPPTKGRTAVIIQLGAAG